MRGREAGGEGSRRPPVTLCGVHGVSLPRLPLQIDVSEDDIDDGFRRLFAQLAGEVGVPRIPTFRALADAKAKTVFVFQEASTGRGRGNKLNKAERICRCNWDSARRPPASSPGLRPLPGLPFSWAALAAPPP